MGDWVEEQRFKDQLAQYGPEIAGAQQQAMAQTANDVNQIIAQGVDRYGEQAFDEMAGTVVEALGHENLGFLNGYLSACDDPVGVVHHLSQHPHDAWAMRNMTPGRAVAHLAGISARLHPTAPATGRTPAWKAEAAVGGRWDHASSDNLSDDQWSKKWSRDPNNRRWGGR